MLEKVKTIYKIWLVTARDLPRGERYTYGQKIDELLLEILENMHRAAFLPPTTKIPLLGEILLKIDSLRFFVQLGWECKLISAKRFAQLGGEIEETGRMVGGWRKGLLTKTSAQAAEEER